VAWSRPAQSGVGHEENRSSSHPCYIFHLQWRLLVGYATRRPRHPPLWESSWIADKGVLKNLDTSKIVVANIADEDETVRPEEVKLFKENAWAY